MEHTEAPFVCWVKMYGSKQDGDNKYEGEFNITVRGEVATETLDKLIELVQYAEETYNLRPYSKMRAVPVYSPAPHPTLSQAQAPPVNPAPAPTPPPIPEPERIPVDGEQEVNYVYVSRLVCIPQPSGKSKLEFWADGRQYPELTATMTPVQLGALFNNVGGWVDDHFTTATTYNLDYQLKVGWVNSTNLTRSGRPYRNIVSIDLVR